jgi:hypothetical protein
LKLLRLEDAVFTQQNALSVCEPAATPSLSV